MGLFLVTSMPLFFAVMVSLPWERSGPIDRLSCVMLAFRGMLAFVPSAVLALIVRGIAGAAYRPAFLHYLSIAYRDHFLFLAAGIAALLLYRRRAPFPRHGDGLFLFHLSFLCGFYALVDCFDFVVSWGAWDLYAVLLLPVLRLTEVTLVSLAASRFRARGGREPALFYAFVSAMGLAAAFLSYLYGIGWRSIATAGTLVAFAALLAYLVVAFQKVLVRER